MSGKFLFIWFEHRPGDIRSAIITPGDEIARGLVVLERHEFDAQYLNEKVPRVNDSELLLKRLARYWPRPRPGRKQAPEQ